MPLDSLTVSVIIPCRNEGRFIKTVLQRLFEQDYSKSFEIIVVDAMSTDDTVRQVESFIKETTTKRIRIIPNEKIIIPAGLNLGIEKAVGEIIVRMDGHALPQRDYLRIAVDTLVSNNYDVVGGICKTKPACDNYVARGVAIGISHIFGVGDSRFRLANSHQKARLVDTVPFGCFKKSLWKQLGGFDETLLANEDYDFNYRVRKNGGCVFLNPELVTEYFARATLSDLAQQYFRYGKWKLKMLSKAPKSLRLRHVIPPAFLLGLLLSGLVGLALNFFFVIFLFLLSAYLLANIIAAIHASLRAGSVGTFPMVIIVFIIMHFSWGGGLLYSFFDNIFSQEN